MKNDFDISLINEDIIDIYVISETETTETLTDNRRLSEKIGRSGNSLDSTTPDSTTSSNLTW